MSLSRLGYGERGGASRRGRGKEEGHWVWMASVGE